jgi:hypothetical protein
VTPRPIRLSSSRNASGLSNARGYRDAEGQWFASYAEGARWAELLVLKRDGQITHLAREVTYTLVVNGVDCGAYRADATYFERLTMAAIVYPLQRLDRISAPAAWNIALPIPIPVSDWDQWQFVVEDTKGQRLDPFPLKQKLIRALYGLEIRIIDSKDYRKPRGPRERTRKRVSY